MMDALLDALPVLDDRDDPGVQADEGSVLGLAELLLKAPRRVDYLVRDETRQPGLIGRLLALSLAAFSLFSVTLVLLLFIVPAPDLPWPLANRWDGTVLPAIWLALVYPLGLVAATGLCLPSFYFLSLLAGVRVSWLQVTNQILEGKAATALLLVGVLPIYVALVLGLVIFAGPAGLISLSVDLGLALPFLAGLWGVWSIYRGVHGLADTLSPECRFARGCFLRRLTVSWAAVYTVVSPVMIFTLWDHLPRLGG